MARSASEDVTPNRRSRLRAEVEPFRLSLSSRAQVWAAVFVALVLYLAIPGPLTLPQEKFEPGRSMVPTVLTALAGAGILTCVAWGISLYTRVSIRNVLRWMGLAGPAGQRWVRGRWVVLILTSIVLGAVIGKLVPALVEIWPSLDVHTPAQEAAEAERKQILGAPAWAIWAHAAGEEVIARSPVVVVAIWATSGTTSVASDGRRLRFVVLVTVCVVSVVGFALMHAEYSWYNAAAIAVMSTATTALAAVARSVWPAAALHAAYTTEWLVPFSLW